MSDEGFFFDGIKSHDRRIMYGPNIPAEFYEINRRRAIEALQKMGDGDPFLLLQVNDVQEGTVDFHVFVSTGLEPKISRSGLGMLAFEWAMSDPTQPEGDPE